MSKGWCWLDALIRDGALKAFCDHASFFHARDALDDFKEAYGDVATDLVQNVFDYVRPSLFHENRNLFSEFECQSVYLFSESNFLLLQVFAQLVALAVWVGSLLWCIYCFPDFLEQIELIGEPDSPVDRPLRIFVWGEFSLMC